MAPLHTWLFNHPSQVNQYRIAPQPIHHAIHVVYQQGQAIIGTPKHPTPTPLTELTLNPMTMDRLFHVAHRYHWDLATVTVVHQPSHQRQTINYHIADPNALYPYQNLVSHLGYRHFQIQAVTLTTTQASQSRITIYHDATVNYDHLTLRKFRVIWTKLITALQHDQRYHHPLKYPLLIRDSRVYLPDFNHTVTMPVVKTPQRRYLKHWIQTQTNPPQPTTITDYYFNPQWTGDYVTIKS